MRIVSRKNKFNSPMTFNYKFTSTELRNKFTNYFKDKGHTHMESSSVVPHNDNSILFVNSGMCQFKKNILNPSDYELRRAVTIQNCIRAGGKHNDLDEVGRDNYHHTFFQMMGQWSFNDYFKEEAIFYAFDFLTRKLNLNRNFFYATYYCSCTDKCNESNACDIESRDIWRQYLNKDQILPFGKEDNFWEMGSTGPCGPCTEIHYDITESLNIEYRKKLVNRDDPTLIEIWNIVFMEFYNDGKNLTKLKEKSVDTGMGLERVLAILNGTNNYGTDLFYDINEHIIANVKKEFFNGRLNILLRENFNISIEIDENHSSSRNMNIVEGIRIVADHSRTVAICLFYNIPFSSEGCGHVLRTIFRRLLHNYCKLTDSYDVMDLLVIASKNLHLPFKSSKIILEEIELYTSTVRKGRRVLANILERNKNEFLRKSDINYLHDTHGINRELLSMLLKEKVEIIDDLQEEKVEKRKEVKHEYVIKSDVESLTENEKLTEVEQLTLKIEDLLLLKDIEENRIASFEEIIEGRSYCTIFSKSNFYGEMGGQVGDRGIIYFDMHKFIVTDTQIYYNFTVHVGYFERNSRNVDGVIMLPDWNRRDRIRKNHTATHIFNYCLKQFNGNIRQMGSLVAPDRLRFDFNRENISFEILQKIEEQVNKIIQKKIPVEIFEISKDKLNESIIFMQNEEYPEKIRLIGMGDIKECCGGSHVSNTGDIELFRIISYSSIGSNKKRIVALTGAEALKCEENFKDRRIKETMSIFQKLNLEEEDRKENDRLRNELKNKIQSTKKKVESFSEDFELEIEGVSSMKDLMFISKGIKSPHTFCLYYNMEGRRYFIIKGENSDRFKSKIETLNGEIFGRKNFFSGNYKLN